MPKRRTVYPAESERERYTIYALANFAKAKATYLRELLERGDIEGLKAACQHIVHDVSVFDQPIRAEFELPDWNASAGSQRTADHAPKNHQRVAHQ